MKDSIDGLKRTAGSYGFDIETTEEGMELSYRSSPGEDEPTDEDKAHVRSFLKKAKEDFPGLSNKGAVSAEACDEWIIVTINLKKAVQEQTSEPSKPKLR